MVRLLPSNSDLRVHGLREVIDRALAEDGSEPPWIAVDDGSGDWLSAVAARPPAERARGVVVSADDAALVAAQRLGVGGAATLPVSTTGLREALRAASSTSLPAPVGDPGILELLAGVGVIKVAAFSNRSFWRAQLGGRVLAGLLAEVATAMESPAALLPWPALILADRDESRILNAWKSLASGPGRPVDDLLVFDVDAAEVEILAAVYTVLMELDQGTAHKSGASPEPVYELPTGRLVGWWSPGSVAEVAEGWIAVPVNVGGSGCRWRLSGGDGAAEVAEVSVADDLAGIEGSAAVRLPGSLTANLRPGTPAGVLLQRLADAAARRGVPLWVPNVDTEALRFLLSFPGILWVDGPAVPR